MKATLLSIVTLLIFASCSKDENINPYPELTNKNWVLSGWNLSYNDNGSVKTVDYFNNTELLGIKTCILDDSLYFLQNYTYQTILGAVSCSPDVTMFGNGKWKISDDSFSLIPTGYTPYIFTLIELSDTLLSFSRDIEVSKKSMQLMLNENINIGNQGTEIFKYRH